MRSLLPGREMNILEIVHLEEGARPGSKTVSVVVCQDLDREGQETRHQRGEPPLPCPWPQPQVSEAAIPVCTISAVSGALQAFITSRDTRSVPLITYSHLILQAQAMKPQSDDEKPNKVQVH